jgi:UDP-N-acetyl-2-amino-2-deoxyglucuronate dehydrogenase
LLSWFFGNAINGKRILISKKTQSGFIEFKNAKIEWMLSTDRKELPNNNSFAYRKFNIGNKEINLSKSFLDLHVESYKNILNSNGIMIKDIYKTYKNIEIIKKSA